MNSRPFLLFTGMLCILSAPAWAGLAIMNPPTVTASSDAGTVLAAPMIPPSAPMYAAGAALPSAIPPNGNAYSIPSVQPVPAPVAAPTYSNPMAQTINGFGVNIPLSVAIRQIVPAGIQVSFAQGVDSSVPITWRGGKPWQDVLADAIRPSSLSVSQNGYTVVISPANPIAMAPTSPVYRPGVLGSQPLIPAGPIPTARNVAPQNTLVDKSHPAVSEPASLAPLELPTWTAKNADTLHQTLEAWCKKANVSLRWDSGYDYPLETNVSITGDFETAVRSLLDGLKNATPRPLAHYYRSNDKDMQGVLLVPEPSTVAAHVDTTNDAAPGALAPITNLGPQG